MKLFIFLLLFTTSVIAGPYYDNSTITTNTGSSVSSIIDNNALPGVATSIAMTQCHFTYTQKIQLCLGYGNANGIDAGAVGGAITINSILINGSIGLEEGDTRYGFGANFKF